jgi:cytochrome c-type biogenesis protein CcmF
MPMTEVAIDRGLMRDLYVALGDPLPPDALGIRIHHKPLVNWIWGGCVLMALGGLLAATDRRYRVAAGQAAGEPGTQALPAQTGEPLPALRSAQAPVTPSTTAPQERPA